MKVWKQEYNAWVVVSKWLNGFKKYWRQAQESSSHAALYGAVSYAESFMAIGVTVFP